MCQVKITSQHTMAMPEIFHEHPTIKEFLDLVHDVNDISQSTGDKDVHHFDNNISSLVSQKETQSHHLIGQLSSFMIHFELFPTTVVEKASTIQTEIFEV